jgi:hypothetical protein
VDGHLQRLPKFAVFVETVFFVQTGIASGWTATYTFRNPATDKMVPCVLGVFLEPRAAD